MKDANGNIKSRTGSDGTSYHAGLEEFAGGLKVPFTDGGWLQATETGFEIYNPTGDLVGGFYTDGSLINANISLDDGFTIPLTDGGSFVANSNGWGFYDSESNLVTGYFADGTSYHSGLETFAGGLEVPSSGGGNTTISPTGVTLYHPESNTTTTISGTTTQVSYLDSYLNEGSTEVDAEGVTTTFTDSFGETSSTELTAYGLKYTNEDGETIEIGPYGITIRDAEGNVMTNFSWNGSSYHAGLEEFAGGARFPNEDGGDLWIDGSGVRIYDELGYENLVIGNDGSVRVATNGGWATVDDNGISLLDGQGNVVTNFSPNGTSTHTGLETYNGGVFVSPNNASPQNGVPGTTLSGDEIRVTDGNNQTGAVITSGEGKLSNDAGESVTTTPKQIIVRIEDPEAPPSTEIPETKIEAGKIDITLEGRTTKIEGDFIESSHLRLLGKDPIGVPEPEPIINATNHLGDNALRLNQYGELSGMNLNYPNGQINNLNSQFIETDGIGAETGNFSKVNVNGAVGVDISLEVSGDTYFDGDVGIGTDSPIEALQVGIEGDGTAAIANDWLTFSDKNLKKDFERLTKAKEKVQQINAYFYYWKDGKDKSRQFGLIAQEVEAVLPEIVTTSKNGVKSIDYSKVSAILIEAFKEQQVEIDNLQKQINSFKQQADNYDTLKSENEQLSKEISEMRTMMKYIIDQMHSEPSGILKTENIHE